MSPSHDTPPTPGKIAIKGFSLSSKAKRRQNAGRDLLPKEERARRDAQEGGRGRGEGEGVDVVNGDEGAIQWGLSVRKRAVATDEEGVGATPAPAPNPDSTAGTQEGDAGTAALPQTADEEALASLLGADPQTKGPDLVIASVAPLSELDAYKAAVLAAPDVSTLEDYERIPVEEFGAAMLRGMGWKGEKVAKPKDVKRRQNLLGLGAKELDGAEELGGLGCRRDYERIPVEEFGAAMLRGMGWKGEKVAKPKDVKRRQNLLGLGAKELDGAEELGAWVQKSDVKRLQPGGRRGGSHGERRVKPGDYKRERERERDRREERGGGSYKRERERERERERDYGDRRDRRR
ncbi:hypothetical protein BUE80_DR007762 [Diplocarpon rosae]|nr:hypothetical protein BUE80_DR007762 [Diplocarpon rosae]